MSIVVLNHNEEVKFTLQLRPVVVGPTLQRQQLQKLQNKNHQSTHHALLMALVKRAYFLMFCMNLSTGSHVRFNATIKS